MKLFMGCVWGVTMVQALAHGPLDRMAKPKAVVPPLVQLSDPQRFFGQHGRQSKEQKPALSMPKEPVTKQQPLLPVNPPSLGLCDGS